MEKNHPNGKYKGVSYHHDYGQGRKSKAPKNGQKALDNSIEVSKSDKHNSSRVGISEGELVVLRESGDGTFHGYVVEWKELFQQQKTPLLRSKMVSSSGKIL